MTTKAEALDRLIDAIAGEDVPMTSQTVAGRIEQLAEGIEDGTITIGGGGGGGVYYARIDKTNVYFPEPSAQNTFELRDIDIAKNKIDLNTFDEIPENATCIGVYAYMTDPSIGYYYSCDTAHFMYDGGGASAGSPIGWTAKALKEEVAKSTFYGFSIGCLMYKNTSSSTTNQARYFFIFA